MSSSSAPVQIKFLTFNVWSCEHVAVYRRIKSICNIIERHDPDVIFLREVTKYIYSIFEKASWWGKYKAMSFPPEEAETHFCVMLCIEAHQVTWPSDQQLSRPVLRQKGWSAKLDLKLRSMGGGNDDDGEDESGERQRLSDHCYSIRVATCRLAAPTPLDVRATLDWSGQTDNAVLGGDMCWDDDIDGPFPVDGREGWVDAWRALRGGDGGRDGWTYDAVANPMLNEWRSKPEIRKRPDRFVCKLKDFELESIEMVGVEPIPGLTHIDDEGNFLPVLPRIRSLT